MRWPKPPEGAAAAAAAAGYLASMYLHRDISSQHRGRRFFNLYKTVYSENSSALVREAPVSAKKNYETSILLSYSKNPVLYYILLSFPEGKPRRYFEIDFSGNCAF